MPCEETLPLVYLKHGIKNKTFIRILCKIQFVPCLLLPQFMDLSGTCIKKTANAAVYCINA